MGCSLFQLVKLVMIKIQFWLSGKASDMLFVFSLQDVVTGGEGCEFLSWPMNSTTCTMLTRWITQQLQFA
jgi:hypothetical protein